jgi:hypothetical protein
LCFEIQFGRHLSLSSTRHPMKGNFMENELREYLAYNPATGDLTWIKSRGSNARVGARAGSLNDQRYVIVRFKSKQLRAHRVAWLLAYGKWPDDQIDHANGIRSDNRLSNLRAAGYRENMFNRPGRKSISGLKGVSPGRNGRFRSQITTDGRQKYLGEFDTAEAAHEAYVVAARVMHGEFARFS